VAADGGVFDFGGDSFFGSLPGIGVQTDDIVGISSSPTDDGYWLAGSDGGVFGFGDALWAGSLPGEGVSSTTSWISRPTRTVMATGWSGPTVGSSPSATPPTRARSPDRASRSTTSWHRPNSERERLLAGRGRRWVFATATPPGGGSLGGVPLGAPIKAIAATTDGGGYWLVGTDGGVFSGSATPHSRAQVWAPGLPPRSSASHPPRQRRGTGLPRAMVARFDWGMQPISATSPGSNLNAPMVNEGD